MEKLYIYTKKNSILYKIACLYDWKEDEKNAIRYYRKYMATVPEDQRYALDEDGNPVEEDVYKRQVQASLGLSIFKIKLCMVEFCT